MSFPAGTVITLKSDFADLIDLPVDMSTWYGRVAVYEAVEDETDQILAVGDSAFLDQLTGEVLAATMGDEGPLALMMLPADQVETAEARDSVADTRHSLRSYRERIDAFETDENPDEPSSFEVDPTYYFLWQFLVSDEFYALSPLQQRMSQVVIAEVSNYMQHFYDENLFEWGRESLEDVLLTLLPEKFFDPPTFYPSLPESLLAFLRFLPAYGDMAPQPLIALVEQNAEAIRRAGEDSSKWGPTKRLIAGMEKHGYDPEDEQQMEAFLMKYGEEWGITGDDIMAEMVNHPDVNPEDQMGMLNEMLNMDELFGEDPDEAWEDADESVNGKE